jgi:hypothetical protein
MAMERVAITSRYSVSKPTDGTNQGRLYEHLVGRGP